MREVVIVSAARTAVGSFGQSLKDVPVVKLGGLVIKRGPEEGRASDRRGARTGSLPRRSSVGTSIPISRQSTTISTLH